MKDGLPRHPRYGCLPLWALLMCLTASGCTTLDVQTLDGTVDRSYWGYVRVRGAPIKAGSPGTGVSELTSLGISTHRGLTVGWSRERLISVPFDCRTVLLLEPGSSPPPTLEEALKRGDLCAAPLSPALPPVLEPTLSATATPTGKKEHP